MDESELWNLEEIPIKKQELTLEGKKLAYTYTEFDMLSQDILPIFDFSLNDNKKNDEE